MYDGEKGNVSKYETSAAHTHDLLRREKPYDHGSNPCFRNIYNVRVYKLIKIIAECGVNFRNLDEAFMFIDECKRLNLFACKFQLFNENNIKEAKPEQQDFLKSIMLTFDDARDLFNYGCKINQNVFFTPMYDCIDFLEELGVKYYKIRLKDNQNYELRHKIEQTEKIYFISTQDPKGMDCLGKSFFCIPEYPARFRDYEKIFLFFYTFYEDIEGISDHTPCTCLLEFCIEEYSGLDYFEKHMKLDSYLDCLEKDWSVSFSQLEAVLK